MKLKKYSLFTLIFIIIITIILVPVLLTSINKPNKPNNPKRKPNPSDSIVLKPTDIVVKQPFVKKDISVWTQNKHFTSVSKSPLNQLKIPNLYLTSPYTLKATGTIRLIGGGEITAKNKKTNSVDAGGIIDMAKATKTPLIGHYLYMDEKTHKYVDNNTGFATAIVFCLPLPDLVISGESYLDIWLFASDPVDMGKFTWVTSDLASKIFFQPHDWDYDIDAFINAPSLIISR